MSNPNWPTVSVAVNFSGSTWTDISAYVWSIEAQRGRQYELDQSRAGSLTLRLDNHDGRFDPTNTSSPYYPNVLLYKKIRVQATWQGTTTTLWQGYVDKWPQTYMDHGNWQTTPLTAVGILGVLKQKVFLPSGEEKINSYNPTYWWPMTSGTVNQSAVQERTNGVQNGQVATFGGNVAVSFGQNPYVYQPLGLEGQGGANFNPANPGYGYPSGMSVVRFMKPLDGQFFPFPLVPWTLTCVIQTNIRPSNATNYNPSYFFEWTDSGGGNGTGKTEYIRFGISAAGWFTALIQDANGSSVYSQYLTQLADGLPHVLSIEFSGTHPNFYYSVDGQGYGVISSGNVNGWVFDQIVVMNVGGTWPTNASAANGYAGVVSELAWYGNQHLVTDGTGGNSPGYGAFANVSNNPDSLPMVILNAWKGQTADQRVQSLMTLAGYGSNFTSLGTGQAILQGAAISGKDAAAAILEVAATEGGPVYERGDGQLVFSPRNYRYAPSPSITVGTGTNYPVSALEYSYDTQHLITQAEIQRNGGNNCIANNTSAQSTYGLFTLQISSSGELTDNQCFAHAQYLVGFYGAPTTRVQKMTIDMAANPTAFALMNSMDINTCIQLNHSPLAGHATSSVLWVESVKYMITPDQFVCSYDASPADQRAWITPDKTGSNTLDNSSLQLAF